jgi:hypothetical protein
MDAKTKKIKFFAELPRVYFLPRAGEGLSAKKFLKKVQKKEEKPLPRARSGALGKENAKKNFAESQIGGSRQKKMQKKHCREPDRGLSTKEKNAKKRPSR